MGGGVSAQGRVSARGVSALGLSVWGGGVCPGGVHFPPSPPWTEFLTNACENITFPQLCSWTVIIQKRDLVLSNGVFI